jgi:hypothetical protein
MPTEEQLLDGSLREKKRLRLRVVGEAEVSAHYHKIVNVYDVFAYQVVFGIHLVIEYRHCSKVEYIDYSVIVNVAFYG